MIEGISPQHIEPQHDSPYEITLQIEDSLKPLRKNLKRIKHELGLKTQPFLHNQEEIQPVLIGLFEEFEIDPKYLLNPERTLTAFVIADHLVEPQSEQEADALKTIFKLSAVDSHDRKTFSGLVRRLAYTKDPAGLEFDPEAKEGSSRYAFQMRLQAFVKSNTNPDQSAQVAVMMADRSENSVLAVARTNLAVPIEKEQACAVVVLTKPRRIVWATIGDGARFTKALGQPTIILPSDFTEHDLGHEFAHGQGGLTWGHRRLLYRGINEAVTEIHCDNKPNSYKEDREMLSVLNETTPGVAGLWKPAYLRQKNARSELLARVLAMHNSTGILYLMRAFSKNRTIAVGEKAQSIYIPPAQAIEYFARKAA